MSFNNMSISNGRENLKCLDGIWNTNWRQSEFKKAVILTQKALQLEKKRSANTWRINLLKMLAPEVWNFFPPSSSVSSKFCDSYGDIIKIIQNQYFTHHVSIVLPDTLKAPDSLNSVLLEDSQFYRINNISAAEFVGKDFSDLFVKKGQLTVISICHSDQSNRLAFLPCGKLVLSLNRKTYYVLGIEGIILKQSKPSLREYSLVLDVASDQMEKVVKNKLKACQHLSFDVILAWEPNESNICPSSIALYFSKKGYSLKTCDIQFESRLAYNVTVPLLDNETDLGELVEWLGAFALQCDMSNDTYISSVKCPEKNEKFGQVMHLTFTGLFTLNRVQKIISEIRYSTERSSAWSSLIVQGFEGSIINLQSKHFYLSDGDQHHTVVFKQNYPTLVSSFQQVIK